MKEKIILIIKNVLPDADLNDYEDLFEMGLDSMGVMTIIAMIQSEFSIEISPEDIIADNFIDVPSIINLLNKYIR